MGLGHLMKAQDTLPKNNLVPSLNFYLGYIPQTYPTAPAGQLAFLNCLGLNRQFNGKDKWHQFFHYPKGGVELFFGLFNNPTEFGNVVGFVPTMELNSKHPKRKWKKKFGLGVAYFNKPFDLIKNPNNYYIGSHFVNMTTLSLLREIKIAKNLEYTVGASLIHFSNGHTKLPNVGLNLLALHMGLRTSSNIERHRYTSVPQKNKSGVVVKLGVGMHEFGATTKAIGGPNYPSYHLSTWFSKSFRNIHVFQLGVTCAYYTSFYDYITSQELRLKNPRVNAFTGLIFVGHEFVFGKFGLCAQAGFYVYNPFFIKQKKIEGTWDKFGEKLEAFSTNRLGLVYYPFKKKNSLNHIKYQLQVGAFIKANLAQADLFEYSVAFSF